METNEPEQVRTASSDELLALLSPRLRRDYERSLAELARLSRLPDGRVDGARLSRRQRREVLRINNRIVAELRRAGVKETEIDHLGNRKG